MSRSTKPAAPTEEAKPALVPKLRFPEFQGAGGWDITTLGSLSEVVRGGSPRPIEGFLTTAADGLNWLKIGDVDKEAKYVTRTAEKVRREALSKTRIVNPGDLILSNSMSFGRPYILQIKTCIHDGWIAITEILDKADRDFLFYWISSPSSQCYFVDNAAGSGVQNLNAEIIKSLHVFYPSRPEQQKIAECLSSLDDLIAAQSRKVDALKTHKKGLMQQLFPQEGETQPHLRFPEFRDAGGWVEESLDCVLSAISNGLSLTQFADNAGYKVTRIETISAGTIDLEKIGFVKPTQDVSAYKLQVGDILFSNINSISHIGKSVFVDRDYDLYHGMNLLRLVVDRSKGEPKFVFYLINTSSIRASLRERANKAVNQASINQTELGKTELAFPSIPEQTRIASFLTSLDELITAQTQKFEALKTHKKGLMQQLFPSPVANA